MHVVRSWCIKGNVAATMGMRGPLSLEVLNLWQKKNHGIKNNNRAKKV